MKKIDLGQTISILANLGVIAGIIFLGVELRQNNEALRVQARLDRQDIQRNMLSRRVDNSELALATVKALQGEQLSSLEVFLLDDENYLRFINFQLVYTDVRDGLLTEDAIPLAAWQSAYHGRYPRMDEAWLETKSFLAPDFVEWFEESVIDR